MRLGFIGRFKSFVREVYLDYRVKFHRVNNPYLNETDRLRDLPSSVDSLSQPVGYNIYGVDGSVQDYLNYENLVHMSFKYRFVMFFVHLGHFFGRKILIDHVKSGYQFRNLRVFDRSFNRSIYEWHELFRSNFGNNCHRPDFLTRVFRKFHLGCRESKLYILKKFYLTLMHNDTAYLEFQNLLMFNIVKEMESEYKSDGCYNHLFYLSKDINDLRYFALTGDFSKDQKYLVDMCLKNSNIRVREVRSSPVTNSIITAHNKDSGFNIGCFESSYLSQRLSVDDYPCYFGHEFGLGSGVNSLHAVTSADIVAHDQRLRNTLIEPVNGKVLNVKCPVDDLSSVKSIFG